MALGLLLLADLKPRPLVALLLLLLLLLLLTLLLLTALLPVALLRRLLLLHLLRRPRTHHIKQRGRRRHLRPLLVERLVVDLGGRHLGHAATVADEQGSVEAREVGKDHPAPLQPP